MALRTQSGDLDRYIALYHRVLTKNDQNEKVVSYPATFANVWAKKRDTRGQKRFLAQQFSNDLMTEWTIRWRDDVSTTDRLISDDGVTYEITQVAEIGRREGLDLLCRAVVS